MIILFSLPLAMTPSEIFTEFSSIFTSAVDMITGNPFLLTVAIAGVALPVLGGVVSILKGR